MAQNNGYVCRLIHHLRDFSLIWIILILIGIGAVCSCRLLAYAGLLIILFLLVSRDKQMNLVYGLIGTSGSIQIFFVSFVVICFLFSAIYYYGFFRNAEISYDVNQPHVRFSISKKEPTTKKDTVFIYSDDKVMYFLEEKEICKYQRITYEQVLRNTVMTALIQEPSDLFASAAIYNNAMYDTQVRPYSKAKEATDQATFDQTQSTLFHWMLILQILISWILLGVFISILYNKFRYES